MKKLFTNFILIFAFSVTIVAQQTDDNTLAINNYFQINNKNQVNNNPSKLDVTIQSYANVVQVGRENNTYIKSLQSGDQQVIIQKGHQNNYEYYNYYSQENSSMQVNQVGNMNSIQVFGENSIMKDAIINQKGSFKSVIIKNY